jgi:hypothetical protein
VVDGGLTRRKRERREMKRRTKKRWIREALRCKAKNRGKEKYVPCVDGDFRRRQQGALCSGELVIVLPEKMRYYWSRGNRLASENTEGNNVCLRWRR